MKKILYLLLFSIHFAHLSSKQYLIDAIETQDNQLIIKPSKKFGQKYLREPVFKAVYENGVDLSKLDELTLSAPFILSVISVIWASGETYYVHKADAQLMKSLNTIKKVYKVFYPGAKWDGELLADALIERPHDNTNNNIIAQVFSGGLDSVYSSIVHRQKHQLLITIQGFSEEVSIDRWNKVKKQVADFARTYGNKTNFFVKSNFRKFIKTEVLYKQHPRIKPWREFCQEGLSLAGVSIPILAAHNCKMLLIPASHDWGFHYAWGSHPFIDNNIAFQNIRAKNHTYRATRQDKIRYIVALTRKGLQKPSIYTCRSGKDSSNCSICEKCLHTINALILEGENPQDYGYATNIRDSMIRTRQILQQRVPFLGFAEGKLYRWKQTQARAREKLKQADLKFIYKRHFRWLTTVNFEEFFNFKLFHYHMVDFKKHMYFLDPQ